MATVLLSSLGGAIGGQFGTLGTMAGRLIGGMVGGLIDNNIFAKDQFINRQGARLEYLTVQSSNYGHMIPIIYGTAVVAGNIIYASPLKEIAHTETRNAGGKGSRITINNTNYTYQITLAIAICEGEIIDIQRIWADDKLLDIRKYNIRVYKGDNTQMPDPAIESLEGVDKTCAYRGTAYIVFENLVLTEFGNRIPFFKFEVKAKTKTTNSRKLENLINSVVMIPGSGEYVYDTLKQYKTYGQDYQYGYRTPLNAHAHADKTNAIISLEQLQETLPNVKWLAIVVNWFADSLDAATAKILPGVEFQDEAMVKPEEWQVNQYTRNTAYLISKDADGRINYGGTVNDKTLKRYIQEVKKNDIKVMLYPMFFIDTPEKPWRGRMTANSNEIYNFFTKADGYNNFIMHYAKLLAAEVDAFVIGSELIGLTKVQDENKKFPAVEALIQLAKQVKSQIGKDTLITYAADWSEYHHSDSGWYNLDDLWMCDAIDVIGIDAYFPITSGVENEYNIEKLMTGWQSGEGYDYYHADDKKMPLRKEYAWKDIRWWWENEHINPDGNKTSWQAKAKNIWFTEYGFPSVDACSNQPNVFWDDKSIESGFPIGSSGRVDFYAQRQAILATELFWQHSDMVTNKFVWTWDARPFPIWPNNKDTWTDGNAWLRGHWIQGKVGIPTLADILADILSKAGIEGVDIDQNIPYIIDGMIISQQSTAKQLLQTLQNAYYFHIRLNKNSIQCLSQNKDAQITIQYEELLQLEDNTEILEINKLASTKISTAINVNYIDKFNDYQIGNYCAKQSTLTDIDIKESINLPIVMDNIMAKNIAEMMLYNTWLQRDTFTFYLPLSYNFLKVCDNIKLLREEIEYNIVITEKIIGNNGMIKITAINNIFIEPYQHSSLPEFDAITYLQDEEVWLEILDIPYNPHKDNKVGLYLAATTLGENWQSVTTEIQGAKSYNTQIIDRAIMGRINNEISAHNEFYIDYQSEIIVNMIHGNLYSIDEEEFDQGDNIALIGNEIIQFRYAEKIADGKFKLSLLKRGLNNSIPLAYNKGERFILLDDNLKFVELDNNEINNNIKIKQTLNDINWQEQNSIKFYYNKLKPFAPYDLNLFSNVNSWVLNWKRRDKIYNDFHDYIDIGNSEQTLQFLVQICYENGEQNNRVIDEEKIILSENDLQNMDEIKVYQLSDIAGLGHEACFYNKSSLS